jgi:hypothetical protein
MQRGCRAAEAATVYLPSVFDKAEALDFINQGIPEDVQIHLALAKQAAVRAGKAGAWRWVAPPPVFAMGALDWLVSVRL